MKYTIIILFCNKIIVLNSVFHSFFYQVNVYSLHMVHTQAIYTIGAYIEFRVAMISLQWFFFFNFFVITLWTLFFIKMLQLLSIKKVFVVIWTQIVPCLKNVLIVDRHNFLATKLRKIWKSANFLLLGYQKFRLGIKMTKKIIFLKLIKKMLAGQLIHIFIRKHYA